MTETNSDATQVSRSALPTRISLLSADGVDELIANTEGELDRLEGEVVAAEHRLREESAHAEWAIVHFERALAGLRNEADLEAKVLLSVAQHQARERVDEAKALATMHGSRHAGAHLASDSATPETQARVIDLRSPHESNASRAIPGSAPPSGVPSLPLPPTTRVPDATAPRPGGDVASTAVLADAVPTGAVPTGAVPTGAVPTGPVLAAAIPVIETTVDEAAGAGPAVAAVSPSATDASPAEASPAAASDVGADPLSPTEGSFWSADDEPFSSRLSRAITPAVALQIFIAIAIVLLVILFH